MAARNEKLRGRKRATLCVFVRRLMLAPLGFHPLRLVVDLTAKVRRDLAPAKPRNVFRPLHHQIANRALDARLAGALKVFCEFSVLLEVRTRRKGKSIGHTNLLSFCLESARIRLK